MTSSSIPVLSEAQVVGIVSSMALTSPSGRVAADDIINVVSWCEARRDNPLIALLMAGVVGIRWNRRMNAPIFSVEPRKSVAIPYGK